MQAALNNYVNYVNNHDSYKTHSPSSKTNHSLKKITDVANDALVLLPTAITLNHPIDNRDHVIVCACALILLIAGKINLSATQNKQDPDQKKIMETCEKVSEWIAKTSIMYAALSKVNGYIHEGGHALAALACFVKAHPIITVDWLDGETVSNLSNGMTSFGKLLGKESSKLLIHGAGLFAQGLFSLGEFIVAHQLQETVPLASQALNYHAFTNLLSMGSHALDTFINPDEPSDYIALSKLGNIPPALAIALFIGIPLCTYLGYKYFENKSNCHKIS